MKDHDDYVEAHAQVLREGNQTGGRLTMVSSLIRNPPKYSLQLLYRNEPVMRLDVNPGKYHFNRDTLEKIDKTHWHIWPKMKSVQPVESDMGFSQWCEKFLSKASIDSNIVIPPPPHGKQSLLSLDFEYEI